MALIDEIRRLCTRLVTQGWRDAFLVHGLDLAARDLEAELSRNLPGIDRSIKGLEDFSEVGRKAIEPGSLANSLLYHMLASPDVLPEGVSENGYPTLSDLDTIENYVFASARRKLSDFDDPVVAVFAYQYRTGPRTAHGFHADVVYSRTGISRVGAKAPYYDGARRGYRSATSQRAKAFCVMPSRFGAFVAEGGASGLGAVLRVGDSDRAHEFLFPRHKLFPGDECLVDCRVRRVEFREWHRTEKLRRIHTAGGIPPPPGFDIDDTPFVRESADLVSLEPVGATTLLIPAHGRPMIRIAKQRNSMSKKMEIVRFIVPRANGDDNRYYTSLLIPSDQQGRPAPEYVNVRTRVRDGKIDDVNELPDKAFRTLLKTGGYEAAHYVDDSCEGAVAVDVALDTLPAGLQTYAAYSLVSAPDFLPRVDQIDIQRWAESNLRRVSDHFNQGGPAPLCDGRNSGFSLVAGRNRRGRMPNPTIASPLNPATKAFNRDDLANLTITAVVGALPAAVGERVRFRESRAATFLPDAASDVFAPGWDVSQHGDELGEFYQNFGLGSPFPEDAKLCAGLNSYWPAAAPDAGRTFPEFEAPTAMPLLDEELGFHPDDPRVAQREVRSERGWDGEYGPFFLKGRTRVNFASVDRSDYVQNTVRGLVRPGILAELDTSEILRRMEALRFCIQHLPPWNDTVAGTSLWLVSARAVADWAVHPDRRSDQLEGSGYLFVFAVHVGRPKPAHDRRRLIWQVTRVTDCRLSKNVLCWNVDDGPIKEVARLDFEPVLAEFPAAIHVRRPTQSVPIGQVRAR